MWRALVLGAGVVLLSGAAALAVSPTRDAGQACVGDCNGSRTVTLDELVTGVNIALGFLPLAQCPRFDCRGSGRLTVDCILQAVDAALNGCGAEPTGSATRPATPTGASPATPTSIRSATDAATVTASETATHTPSAPTATRPVTRPPRSTVTVTPPVSRTSTSANTPTLTPTQPGDAVTAFDSRSAFTAAAGALLTDDYEDPGYAEFQDDASISGVKGLTSYKTTFFPDFDEVIATPNGHIYAGGFTSGSFQIDFTAPALGGSGVHAVGFDFANNIPKPYVAVVSFADGTSRNVLLHASAFQILSPLPDFLGLTSSVEITRIHFGLIDGGATSDNLFAIDNLSVAAPESAATTATPTAIRATNMPTATSTQTAAPSPTARSTVTAARASTPSPTSTPSAAGTPMDETALAAVVRVATEPLFRFFDVQASVGTPGSVAGPSIVAGCQRFDCIAGGHVTGSEEDCCIGTRFTQVFDDCTFDDALGRIVRLNGSFTLGSDNVEVCTGVVPLGAEFTASLSGVTHDVSFPDGSFSRTFQELSETFQVATGGCTVRQPQPLGLGIRGDGRRLIDGELQQFQIDAFGNVLVDRETDVQGLAIEVSSTGQPTDCTVSATLNGSLSSADFRKGAQFTTDFTDVRVVQLPQAGALSLEVNGPVRTDCLGDVRLSTVAPLQLAPGDTCFTAGRLEAEARRENAAVSATYTDSGVDLDIGADGSVDQHFASCADVPAGQCTSKLVGLCGACTAPRECQLGLSCFPCSADCTENTSRCSLADAFVTCEGGVF